ncbi:MAG: DUF192 domain-containing protein [Gammaproteobacteria bacterium]
MLARKWVIASILIVLIFALHTLTLASGIPDHLQMSDLAIETDAGDRYEFVVYQAETPADRSRGLMYVDNLDEKEGMIFDTGNNLMASIWMKNTPIPLDVLFLTASGHISSIEEDLVPYSRKTVHSREPVRAVLEINGGLCRKLDIKPGDQVLHHYFNNVSEKDPG